MTGDVQFGPLQAGCWLFAAWAVAERWAQWRGLQQAGGTERESRSLVALQATFYGAVLGGLADATALHATTLPAKLAAWRWAGVALAAAGLAVRVVARATLGRQFSGYVETSPEHRLVTAGVYRWVRHPLYLGYLGLLVGFPLAFGSVGALGLAVLAGLPALALRIRVEEAALGRWFGADYEAYRRRTWGLIPGVW